MFIVPTDLLKNVFQRLKESHRELLIIVGKNIKFKLFRRSTGERYHSILVGIRYRQIQELHLVALVHLVILVGQFLLLQVVIEDQCTLHGNRCGLAIDVHLINVCIDVVAATRESNLIGSVSFELLFEVCNKVDDLLLGPGQHQLDRVLQLLSNDLWCR